MKKENFHEKVLKPGLNGNPEEASCIKLRGDATVLAKLIGVQNAQILLDAQKPQEKIKKSFKVHWPKFKKAQPEPNLATA
jgi:hypothetical protein